MARPAGPDGSRKICGHSRTQGSGPQGCRSGFGPRGQDTNQASKGNESQPRPRLLVSSMYETIIFTTAGPISTIRLNRPEKLNAFGGPMREEILDVLGKIGTDDRIRVVIVTGEGRGFSAGGDIEH